MIIAAESDVKGAHENEQITKVYNKTKMVKK